MLAGWNQRSSDFPTAEQMAFYLEGRLGYRMVNRLGSQRGSQKVDHWEHRMVDH